MDFLRQRFAAPIFFVAVILAVLLRQHGERPQLAPLVTSEPTSRPPLSAQLAPVETFVPQPTATFGPPPTPTPLPDWVTEHLDIVDSSGIYSAELELLSAELQTALEYVSRRVGIAPSERIYLRIFRDAHCGLHGVTYSLVRVVEVYSCETIARRRVVNIAAHEFVHQLAQDRYGEQHQKADLLLMEGFATWGAGRYWLGDRANFDEFAREYRANGYNFPLDTDYRQKGTIAVMNALYYQWGSFVEYLLTTYGRERFDKLYSSGGDKKPGAADYRGIYGKTFAVLETEWQEHFKQLSQ